VVSVEGIETVWGKGGGREEDKEREGRKKQRKKKIRGEK
jgi:hypothetical protein